MNVDGLPALFIRQARRVARFEAGGPQAAKCISCVRKRYSFPDTCDEGWERWRSEDTGGCANWIGWDTMAGPRPEGGGP